MADYNVALGVKPPEPVNYLGQMGQLMALRAAQDELQGNEAVKQFYTQGGDLSSPEAIARLKSMNPKFGMAAEKAQLESQKTRAEVAKLGYENVDKAFAQSRQFLANIDPNSPDAGAKLIAWHEANHADPVLGALLKSRGIDAAQSRAGIMAAAAKGPAGITDAIRRYSMGQAAYQEKLLAGEQAEKVANIHAGPGWAQAKLARERFDYDKANPALQTLQTENGYATFNPRTGETKPISAPGAQNALAPRAQTQTPSVTNALNAGATGFTTVPPPVMSPSALSPQAAPAAAPAPAAAAPTQLQPYRAPAYKDIVDPTNPKQTITVDAHSYRGGGVGSTGVLGVAGREANVAREEAKRIAGNDALNSELDNLEALYGKLNQAAAIPSTKRGTLSNIAASGQASGVGQFFGRLGGTEEQSARDLIRGADLRLLNAIKAATGMSAQQLNSNMELQTWLKALSDPSAAYETNMQNLENIRNFIEKNSSNMTTAPKAAPKGGGGKVINFRDLP